MESQLREALRAALEWIDAVPAEIVASLPPMPGFDRDWADGLADGGGHILAMLERASKVPSARFKPGKLNEVQRGLICAASGFHKGEPVPLPEINMPYQGRHSLNGLVTRGFLQERGSGLYYLTANGYRTARAIYELGDHRREVGEIDRYLALKWPEKSVTCPLCSGLGEQFEWRAEMARETLATVGLIPTPTPSEKGEK